MSAAHPLSADRGPIDPKFIEQMNGLARVLDEAFNGPGYAVHRKVGFFLTCFPFEAPGRFNYISNADKLDVLAMLKDVTARIEARSMPAGRA
jgi:hypothetical protein